MKVKIYVDWDYREVISCAEEKEKIMKRYIEEVEDDRMCHTEEYLEESTVREIRDIMDKYLDK